IESDTDLGAEPLHGTPRSADALGLVQVVGEFLMRPVSTVEALFRRPVDDPAAHLVGEGGGNVARLALGFLGLQRGETAIAVGVEPARDGLALNAQGGSNILARPSPVGHQDDLKPIAEASVSGGAEAGVEVFGLGWWQVNANHGAVPSKRPVVPSS